MLDDEKRKQVADAIKAHLTIDGEEPLPHIISYYMDEVKIFDVEGKVDSKALNTPEAISDFAASVIKSANKLDNKHYGAFISGGTRRRKDSPGSSRSK